MAMLVMLVTLLVTSFIHINALMTSINRTIGIDASTTILYKYVYRARTKVVLVKVVS